MVSCMHNIYAHSIKYEVQLESRFRLVWFSPSSAA